MSETKIVKSAQPHITISSTDPFRIVGKSTQHTPGKGKHAAPRVLSINAAPQGVKMIGQPAQHDMRRSGPASLGKTAPITPGPMKASEASQAAQAAARSKGEASQRELAARREELEELRAENARLREVSQAAAPASAKAADPAVPTGANAGDRPIELE